MQLNKHRSYFFLLGLITLPFLLYKGAWIFSDTTEGEIIRIYDQGRGLKRAKTINVSYHVNWNTYEDYFLLNGADTESGRIEVRYLTFAPGTARINNFYSMWMMSLVIYFICLLVLTGVFYLGEMSENFGIKLSRRFPFISFMKDINKGIPVDVTE